MNTSRDPEPGIVVFAHIPKTAGSTLSNIMRRQFRPEEVLSYEDSLWSVQIRELPDLVTAGLKGINCVIGHTPFGLHETVGREVKYVTFLRDPLELTLSYYSYVKERLASTRTPPKLPQNAFFADVPRMSVDEWVRFMDETGMGNMQTRHVAGLLDLKNPVGPHERLPDDAIDLARVNLFSDRTTFGIVEHFDLSLLLFKKRLGWKNIYYRKENVTKARLGRDRVSRATEARIREVHAQDFELYRMGLEEFRKALRRQGLDKPGALWRFQAANGAYGILRTGMGTVRKLKRIALDAAGSH
jgi:hypothetical protein